MTETGLDLLAVLEEDILRDAPLAPTLRKCILLGGRAGSSELRDWASQELDGYTENEKVPGYRRVPAPIMVDIQLANQWRTGQIISPSIIPEYAREMFSAGPVFYDGIGVIEAMATEVKDAGGSKRMTHAYAMDVCVAMDKASGNPYQQTMGLYWQVSYGSIVGIVEHVRTRLAELVAEMRVHTPLGQALPSPEVASDAVRRIIQEGSLPSKG